MKTSILTEIPQAEITLLGTNMFHFLKKEKHRLKSGKGYVIVPMEGSNFLGLVATAVQ